MTYFKIERCLIRGVVQLVRMLVLGTSGRRFESDFPYDNNLGKYKLKLEIWLGKMTTDGHLQEFQLK